MNLYPEVDALGTGKEGEQASLVSTPGLTLKCTLPASPVRGVWTASNGQLYAVAGRYLYSISNAWAYTQIGQLNTTSGNVSMSDNGINLVLVDGTNGYTCVLIGNAFTQITDPNFINGATQVSYLDGYFIFNKANTKSFFCSDLLAVTFTALNSAAKEGSPDYIVGHCVTNQQLYLFGSQSLEIWYDSGSTPCPFSRIQGASIRYGCAAPFSIAKVQSVPYWLGGDDSGIGIIYMMPGNGAPQRISTPAIEAAIRSAGTTNAANARAWTYQQGGHAFYCLNVPGLSTTWVYDAITGSWHERTFKGSWGFERHKVDCSSVAYGANVVGDYASGNIYTLDQSSLTDNGTPIVRLRSAPHLTSGLVRLMHSRFQLDMETGVGLDGTTQGSDPKVMLRWSDDGGHSWSNEHWVSAGKIGKTKTRAIWRRLGHSRDRVYEVSISDPVKVTLIGAILNIEAGSA